MAQVRRTVGVYDKPQKPGFNVRLAVTAAVLAAASLGAAAVYYF